MKQRHIIIGTSGHIDHGKSAIVKALTGTDPDRLQEEKERGMTIDLGYAFYGDNVAFIDVPGHERFIKNMVAGVTTIDFVMLVVAADDGVMPQTREHLDILQLLGVKRGLVVINKIDLVDPEWLELVESDVRDLIAPTFLRDAPVVRVSAVTGEGIPELKKVIDRMVAETPPREDRGYYWQPIDRSFTIQGFGTVITGSVLSGSLRAGEEVELLPRGRILKVRGLQRHGKPVDEVRIGDRAAVNLSGIGKDEILRGDILATPGYGKATRRLDVQLQLLPSSPWNLKDQDRVRLHVGTSEVFARCRLLSMREMSPGTTGYVQLILEEEVAVNRYDRFVIRKYSPPVTIGGGMVLDQLPLRRHKRMAEEVIRHFDLLAERVPQQTLREILRDHRRALSLQELASAVSLERQKVAGLLEQLVAEGKVLRLEAGGSPRYVEEGVFNAAKARILDAVRSYHERHPHLAGPGLAEIASRTGESPEDPLMNAVIQELLRRSELVQTGKVFCLPDFRPGLKPDQREEYERLKAHLRALGFAAPKLEDLAEKFGGRQQVEPLLAYGKSTGELVVLSNGLIYLGELLEQMKELISKHCEAHGSIRVADFRDLIGTSRKYAVALLEYFDEIGFTVRNEDERFLA